MQCKPDHVYSKFSWGNKRSLWDQPAAAGIDVPVRLQQYYKQQYSAERMALVVLGGQPLEELEQWVGELFGGVPGGLGPRPSFSGQGMPFQVGDKEACSEARGDQVQQPAAAGVPAAFQVKVGGRMSW
jgi:secreted Zn-dependent insulinase-like peptidase